MRVSFFILNFLLINIFFPGIAFSAPESGITGFSGEKKILEKFPLGIRTAVRFDHQKTIFRTQTDQFPYINPNDPQEEERHYSKKRSSENTTDLLEFEAGLFFSDTIYVYGKAGYGKFYTELNLLDETFQGIYKDPILYEIKDDSLFIYGGGVSFNIYEQEMKKFFKKIDCYLNFQYRKFSADTKNYGKKYISYDLDLDEIQGSLILSGDFHNKKIYFGPRMSSITGNEKLKTGYNNFSYDESIKTSKNMGWVMGIIFFNKDKYSISFQKRTGDEEGISFETSIDF